MDKNFFGPRQIYPPLQQPSPVYFPPTFRGSVIPGIEPVFGIDPAMQIRPPPQTINCYGQSLRPNIATPNFLGGGYPMWDMDIPSHMFMQAVNFENLIASQMKTATNFNTVPGKEDHAAICRSDAGHDLVIQQQTVEQARLLHRFKELRQLQHQQQEMLMSHHQQELGIMSKEQERMQDMISKQRDLQLGGCSNPFSDTVTPPRRQIPYNGIDASHLSASAGPQLPVSQSVGSLPKPVIYVQPNDDDDEIKTNPDLFSDTNSNRGSQAGFEDGMFPIPDSASEASVDVGMHQLRQQNIPAKFRPRPNPHELDAPKKLHRSFAELEADEEFINMSSQSPTLLEMHHGKNDTSLAPRMGKEYKPFGNDDDDDSKSETRDEDDDDENRNDDDSFVDDDFVTEEEDEDDENQEDTQIEVVPDSRNNDDVPIKPGLELGKTFEQLLEEQLKAEEERLKQTSSNQQSPSQPKRSFLKKGEGIARFEMKPDQRKPYPKKPQPKGSSLAASTTVQKNSAPKPTSNGAKTKPASTAVSKPPMQALTKSQNVKKKEVENRQQKVENKGKKASKNVPVKELARTKPETEPLVPAAEKKLHKTDSIPDDASFVASLKDRQKESDRDKQELDEFEILEDFADNMSFCSNSSIVTKGLCGLQSEKILFGGLPKQAHEVGRPASPRAALIKKLKEAESQQATNHSHSNKVHVKQDSSQPKGDVVRHMVNDIKQDKVEPIRHMVNDLKQDKGEAMRQVMKSVDDKGKSQQSSQLLILSDKNDVRDEFVSESSEEDSSDLSDSDENDDDVKGTNKPAISADSWFNGDGEIIHDFLNVNRNVSTHNGKNDSVCSTDKKLERVLSFTGMTETSISQTSESEQDLDSSVSGDSDVIEEMSSSNKLIIRKVAGRDDKNKLSGYKTDFLTSGFNSSSFAPKAKSPLVISKEKLPAIENKSLQPIEESKFSYHSDSDSAGNRKNDSFSDPETKALEKEFGFKKKNCEKKTLQFDDDEAWDENTPKIIRANKNIDSGEKNDHEKTITEESEKQRSDKPSVEKSADDTPPTSKLVTRLFPKLKPQQKKQEEQQVQKIQSLAQCDVGDGIQSKILRDKLMELSREIEKFRNENKHLATLRAEREEGVEKLKIAITAFEKEKTEELKRIEEFRNEEIKKLKHERKMFEKYQKAARAGPDKKEREEIESLKLQLGELQEEMKRKESRWTQNNTRLRDKIDLLEQENVALKEEIKILEKKRLEWLQKDQKTKEKTQPMIQVPLQSSTPAKDAESVNHCTTNGFRDDDHLREQFNDLSATVSTRSSLRMSQQTKASITSSFPPSDKLPDPFQIHPMQKELSQSAHHKISNVNNSSKQPTAGMLNSRGNLLKKTVAVNSKPGQPVHSLAHGTKHKHSAKMHTVTGVNSVKCLNSTDNKNVLLNSLTEDLPRQELGTSAQPQCMVKEEDGEVSIHDPTNLPRKLATRPSVDKSVIDKGDQQYDENQHNDGKVERIYKNGAREILFSNGTKKEISADGKTIIVSFFNGDIKQILPDQRVIYYYAESQTEHTTYPDGIEILQFPNQHTEKLHPDGTKEITFPDQTIKCIFPNGSEDSYLTDGTVIRVEKNGNKIMEYSNGQREIHTQQFKQRVYPDGTVKTIYPDGRQETRYSNGLLRMKDKDGNVIVDRLC